MNRLTRDSSQTAQQQEQTDRRRALIPPSHVDLDALTRISVALVMLNPAIFAAQEAAPMQNPLQIVSAGVETSEDAPFVGASYRFLPGDYVYCVFQIAGYAAQKKGESDVRKISLTFEITPQDAKGIALTPAASGVIQEELSAEDKNWTPKRRASFLLPSFLAAGDFHLHVVVTDVIGHISTERDLPFHAGGTVVAPTESLTVQDFQFLRKEDDTEPLDVPAYAPGDTIYARFTMTGFRLAAGNGYRLSYGLTVNRPDGKPYLSEQTAASLSDSSFYPVAFVPSSLSIATTRTTARGHYVLLLTVHDLTSSQKYQVKRTFTIE